MTEEPYALVRASTGLWEPWAGNRPGPPGPIQVMVAGKSHLVIVSKVGFHSSDNRISRTGTRWFEFRGEFLETRGLGHRSLQGSLGHFPQNTNIMLDSLAHGSSHSPSSAIGVSGISVCGWLS